MHSRHRTHTLRVTSPLLVFRRSCAFLTWVGYTINNPTGFLPTSSHSFLFFLPSRRNRFRRLFYFFRVEARVLYSSPSLYPLTLLSKHLPQPKLSLAHNILDPNYPYFIQWYNCCVPQPLDLPQICIVPGALHSLYGVSVCGLLVYD